MFLYNAASSGSASPAPAQLPQVVPRPISKRTGNKRSSRACATCRARKVRCNVVAHGAPCSNCRHDEIECILPLSKRQRYESKVQQSVVKLLIFARAGQLVRGLVRASRPLRQVQRLEILAIQVQKLKTIALRIYMMACRAFKRGPKRSLFQTLRAWGHMACLYKTMYLPKFCLQTAPIHCKNTQRQHLRFPQEQYLGFKYDHYLTLPR
jgi:hypothetical protein